MSFRGVWICLLLMTLALATVPLAADDLPSWTSIGPDGGQVETLATSPALPGRVFAGLTANGYGIFRSTDRGRTWGASADQLGRNVFDLTIGADGAAIYAATDAGLLKSTDGGALWSAVEGSERTYTLVQAHPRRPGMIFAVRDGVLFRSTEGGGTRQVFDGPEGVLALAFSSGRRTLIYAAAGNGLWKSADTGQTWRRLDLGFPGLVQTIAADPRNPRVLYAGLVQNRRVLLKSTDAGATWKLSQRGLPIVDGSTLLSVGELAVDRTDSSIVYAVLGQQELLRSSNAGRTWARAGRPPGLLLNDLETTRYGLLAGTSAGVFLSTDRGLTWQIRTSGLVATSITGLAIDHQDPPRLYAGDANAGTFKTVNRGRPWLRLGDIAEPFAWARPLQVDPDDPLTVYAGSTGAVAKSTNGGRRWTRHDGLSCLAVLDLLLDPRETSRLYASGQFFTSACGLRPGACTFYRSLDAGETWRCIPEAQYRFTKPLGIDPFTSAVYAQALGGHLLRSTDGGTTWTVLFENLSASSFATSPLVQGTLWAGGDGRVRRSRDGGLTWQDFFAGLPAESPVVELAPDPAALHTLYAATEGDGIFKSTDAGETWSLAGIWPSGIRFQNGLLLDPTDPSIVYAGTDGLGVLRLDQEGR